jgi:acyl-CoA synthetase (NDP forming)
VGIVAEAGGGGISTADACEALGLEVNPFSAELQKQLMDFLKDYLPPFSGISNPLDIVWLTPDVAVKVGTKCLELVATEVDSIIFMSYPTFFYPELRPAYIESMCQLRDRLKMPIFVVPPYAARGAEGMKEFTTAGFPAFPSFERAARAVSATVGYQEWVSSRKRA